MRKDLEEKFEYLYQTILDEDLHNILKYALSDKALKELVELLKDLLGK